LTTAEEYRDVGQADGGNGIARRPYTGCWKMELVSVASV